MISPETISAVRDRTDIVALIGENVRLKKQGRRWTGLCPFHKEKTPSFSVNQERGVFYCFGCKESGSAIDYLMKLDGYTFPEAVRALAERAGIEVEEGSSIDRERHDRDKQERDELYGVNQMVATFFQQQMGLMEGRAHPLAAIALAELERRGLSPGQDPQVDEALSAFRIGYAPYGWDTLVDFLRQQDVSPRAAEQLGVVGRRSSGSGFYDAFRHRLMFAVVDKVGRVVAFSGRALPEPDDEHLRSCGLAPMYRPSSDGEPRRPPPKYINSPESPIYVKGETVFGLHQARLAIRERGQAVLVEGNFDVLALHARGLDQVVAPLGTAFTSHQAKLIKRYAPEVVVLFDGDEAGRKATLGMRGPAREAGLSVKVGKLDAGVDPDDLAREHGVEAVERLIKGSRSMLEHLIEGTLGSHAAWNGPEELLGRVREVVGFIAEENDPNLREMAKTYADDIASKLTLKGRSPESLLALERLIRHGLRGGDTEIRQMERELRSGPDGKAVGAGSRSRPNSEQMALAALGALFDFPELFDDSGVEDALAALEGEVALTVASVRQLWDRKKTLQGAELLDLLPEAIHSFAVGRLAAPHFSKLELARAELVKNTEKLRRRALTGDKAVKVQELTRAQSQGDVETEDELLRELERVAREKRRMS